jgi:thiol:disulfide interchange protein
MQSMLGARGGLLGHIAALSALVVLLPAAFAQTSPESPVRWSARNPKGPVPAGGAVEIHVEAAIDGNWHLYSVTQPPGGPNPTKFSVAPGQPLRIAGAIRQSNPETEMDPNFGIPTEFFTGGAEFFVPLEVAAGTAAGEYPARIEVVYQVCNDRLCLPPTKAQIAVKVRVAAGKTAPDSVPPSAPTASAQPTPVAPPPVPAPITPPARAPEARSIAGTAAEVAAARAGGLLPFLWLAMTMGALSLATPCVFPMIPITVSYFTKGAELGRGAGVKQALVYSAGIVLTFTGLGLGLAAVLGATGINQFAANPWVNLAITAVFVAFALNLFGLYQIGVPSSVLTRLSRASEARGYVATLLMGLTFTLTSFTCTVPFVGTVLVATAGGDWLWPAAGMAAFSAVFAAPFFALALVPALVTRLPRSGGWMNSVKVTMGFLEIAAAMKFISNVDLVWNWRIFTREVVLAVWLAVAVLACVYLLGKFRLPHDTPVESLGVLRMVSALVFLALAFYLFTGLVGGSLGELDAFLPPRSAGSFALTGSGRGGPELTWHTRLEPALRQAALERKPVFIDFTGYTCTNCRWMEANIFPLPAVSSELERYVRVQLYTDGSGPEYEENQRWQKEQFGTVALPLYAILDAQGKKLATFPGMTRKPEEFLQFLRAPFAVALTK